MKIRRSNIPIQLEMTPLIDVVFLLLTFFIFALVLMVRADVLDISLPEVGTGSSAGEVEAVIVTLTEDGAVLVEGEPTPIGEAGERLKSLLVEREGTVVMLAADARVPAGELIKLADALVAAGVREFSVIGTPAPNPRVAPGSTSGPESLSPDPNPGGPGAEE